jgi:hypothetical protein
MFTCILTVGNAKSKIKIEAFEETIMKIMSFDHPEVLDWFIADGKLYPKTNSKEKKTVMNTFY